MEEAAVEYTGRELAKCMDAAYLKLLQGKQQELTKAEGTALLLLFRHFKC